MDLELVRGIVMIVMFGGGAVAVSIMLILRQIEFDRKVRENKENTERELKEDEAIRAAGGVPPLRFIRRVE